MKVLITERFEKKYYKKFQNHFTLNTLSIFLKSKSHTLILLHSPFQKFKGKVWNSEIRWVAVVIKNTIIPITIFLKKDKSLWENISWKTQESLILEEYDFATKDVREKKYKKS